jgi:hypothetical protein
VYGTGIKVKIISFLDWILHFTNFNLIPKNNSLNVATTLNLFRPFESDYGLIRVGNVSDGGYLLPNDLAEIEKCISPGCDSKVEFERQLWKDFKIPSLIIDKLSQLPSKEPDGAKFIPKWLHPLKGSEFVTLEELCEDLSNNLLLQMDIEGAEYSNLIFTSRDILSKFRIMVIEFHDLSRSTSSQDFLSMLDTLMNKILETHYVAHFHENTTSPMFKVGKQTFPSVIEVTFHRLDRVTKLERPHSIRHHLDAPNDPASSTNDATFNFKFDYLEKNQSSFRLDV